MSRFSIVAALSLVACAAQAEPARLAQSTVDTPGVGEPAPKPAPLKKVQKPKPKDGQTAPKTEPGYRTINTGQRRISRDDLEDDPAAPAGSSLRPMLTPEGRAGVGGRF